MGQNSFRMEAKVSLSLSLPCDWKYIYYSTGSTGRFRDTRAILLPKQKPIPLKRDKIMCSVILAPTNQFDTKINKVCTKMAIIHQKHIQFLMDNLIHYFKKRCPQSSCNQSVRMSRFSPCLSWAIHAAPRIALDSALELCGRCSLGVKPLQ